MERTMLEKPFENRAVRDPGQLPKHSLVYAAALILGLSLVSSLAQAHVTRMVVTSREVAANGMSFGDTGPYEKLRGTVFFEVDPDDPRNAAVFDLDKAPRNEQGRVEFSADMMIIKPVDLDSGNPQLFLRLRAP